MPPSSLLKRRFVQELEARLREENPLIQVILGPRQVGKTTGVQMLEPAHAQLHYVSADDALVLQPEWIDEQWQAATAVARSKNKVPILVIDEIQKVLHWSGRIKSLWDLQKRKREPFKLVLLGSSSLSLSQGLEESLAGRFEIIPAFHWDFLECQKQFGYTLDEYLIFGGYPEAARFRKDPTRWQSYLKSSIIEAVIGKDILRQQNVRKPALFRQTFELLASFPAQEISYTKLLGQLQDGGNVELIKNYIRLFEGAYLFRSIQKYSGSLVRQKSSSPKIFPLCPSLATCRWNPRESQDPAVHGRIFESAVGALLSRLPGELHYWRDKGISEVDFVYLHEGRLLAIEVKSGRRKSSLGLTAFLKQYPKAKPVFVTPQNFGAFSKDTAGFLDTVAN